MTSAPAPIQAEQLTKRFGDFTAVDNVSLTVEAGEVFGFLGPNGAGKSTTIRLLLGQLMPSEGRAWLHGRSAQDPRSRIDVGYLPSDLALDPRQNARDVLTMLAGLRRRASGRAVPRADIDALVERFGLDPSRAIGKLSRGNRQKVGVVAAFMADPAILMLDEPTSGLDPLLQAEFQHLVSERAAAGAAVLLSSHVLSEVEHLADRVGVIRSGSLQQVGTIDELRSQASQHLTIRLQSEPEADERATLELGAVDGVTDWSLDQNTIKVTTAGAAQPILDALSGFAIERITSTDDLEDLFLGFYGAPPPPPPTAADR